MEVSSIDEEKLKEIANSIARDYSISVDEARQAIYSVMKNLPPVGDEDIAMIRNNPSLNIFQKLRIINKIKEEK